MISARLETRQLVVVRFHSYQDTAASQANLSNALQYFSLAIVRLPL